MGPSKAAQGVGEEGGRGLFFTERGPLVPDHTATLLCYIPLLSGVVMVTTEFQIELTEIIFDQGSSVSGVPPKKWTNRIFPQK